LNVVSHETTTWHKDKTLCLRLNLLYNEMIQGLNRLAKSFQAWKTIFFLAQCIGLG